MVNCLSKLALGSANFGIDYGVANNNGKILENELEEIILAALETGIKVIDTAQAYGDSEARLGRVCCDERFKLITKILAPVDDKYDSFSVTRLVWDSCKRLNRSNLYAVMLHRPEILLCESGKSIIAELHDLKAKNVISKFGVSIYDPTILDEVLKVTEIDIVQAPFNVFDRRIISSGWANKLKKNGTEIHTRSAFLQGVLLMQKAEIPNYFLENWSSLFNSWFEYLQRTGNSPLSTALGFVLKQSWIDKVVVGVDSATHLKMLAQVEKSFVVGNFPNLKCDDESLINPSKWKLM